jgi:hypothetical protein
MRLKLEEDLRSALNLDDVDPDLMREIGLPLQGRPRFSSSMSPCHFKHRQDLMSNQLLSGKSKAQQLREAFDVCVMDSRVSIGGEINRATQIQGKEGDKVRLFLLDAMDSYALGVGFDSPLPQVTSILAAYLDLCLMKGSLSSASR